MNTESEIQTIIRRINNFNNNKKRNVIVSSSPFSSDNINKEELIKEKERIFIDLKRGFNLSSEEIDNIFSQKFDIKNILSKKMGCANG